MVTMVGRGHSLVTRGAGSLGTMGGIGQGVSLGESPMGHYVDG